MMERLFGVVVALAVVGLVAPGCSSDGGGDVTEASCSACAGSSYSEADCNTWGAAAGCATSSFVATVSGCNNGCSFKSCREPPQCGATKKDAGVVDAAVAPECANTKDGLWTSTPPCSNPGTAKINGVSYSTCPCTGGCPCNFKCGSIPLSVGGTIGNVCAP